MAANRELVDDIFGDSDEEEFVGFSREELGIHSDLEVEEDDEDDDRMILLKKSMTKLLRKLSTKNGQEP